MLAHEQENNKMKKKMCIVCTFSLENPFHIIHASETLMFLDFVQLYRREIEKNFKQKEKENMKQVNDNFIFFSFCLRVIFYFVCLFV